MSRRELDDIRTERALIVLLIVVTLLVGGVSAFRARSFDPRPDAARLSVVADR
jgi:hypothetical protein